MSTSSSPSSPTLRRARQARLGLPMIAAGLVVSALAGASHGAAPGPAAQEPVLVSDLNLGEEGSSPGYVTEAGGVTYFAAYDDDAGAELWRTAGTASTTTRVADILPGAASSFPSALVELGGRLLFVADDGSGDELWRSDGTAAGTRRVADINPRGPGLRFSELVAAGDHVYFRANDGSSGDELWRSDGTAAGTVRVADIDPGAGSGYPRHIAEASGVVYFSADDGIHGMELWRTDGTAAGTRLVADLMPGEVGSNPGEPVTMRGSLYFAATTETDRTLWKTDGTAAGTVRVTEVGEPSTQGMAPPDGVSDVTAVGDQIFFIAETADTEGSSYGRELWRTDGTAAGTLFLADINQGVCSSNSFALSSVGDALFLRAITLESGFEVWTSDGTTGGTHLVKDIMPGPEGSTLNGDYTDLDIADVDGTAYFLATDGVHGEELWRSDGTSSGTELVADLRAGAPSSRPSQLAAVDGTLYFSADDGARGGELWRVGPGGGPPVDTTPPETTITSGPAEGTTTDDNTPTFSFAADESGSTFTCSVDAGGFAGCASPLTLPALADGVHTFRVRAIDPAGNIDPTPASRSFTVAVGGTPPDDTTVDGTVVRTPAKVRIEGGALTLETKVAARQEHVDVEIAGAVAVTRPGREAVRFALTTSRGGVGVGSTDVFAQQLEGKPRQVKKLVRRVKKTIAQGGTAVAEVRVELRDAAGNVKATERKVKIV